MDKTARKRTLAMHHMPFFTWKFIHIIRVIAAVTQTSCPKRRKLCYTSVPVKVAQYLLIVLQILFQIGSWSKIAVNCRIELHKNCAEIET